MPPLDRQHDEVPCGYLKIANAVPPRMVQIGDKLVQCRFPVAVATDTFDGAVVADSDENDPTVGVREGDRGFLEPALTEPLLELDEPVLLRELEGELPLSECADRRALGLRMEERI